MRSLRWALAGTLAAWLVLAGAGAAPEALVNVAGPAHGTRVSADTQYSEKHAAANAADGRLAEGDACWYSKDWTKLPCALTLQLAAEEEIRRVVVHQARWHGNMYHTKDFALEASGDGKAWRRVATGTLPDDNAARAAVDVSVRTRWLRVLVLTSYNPQQTCGLTEVELLVGDRPAFGAPEIRLNGKPAPPPTSSVEGLSFVGGDAGPQVVLFALTAELLAALGPGEEVSLALPVLAVKGPFTLRADLSLAAGERATAALSVAGRPGAERELRPGEVAPLSVDGVGDGSEVRVVLCLRGAQGSADVRCCRLRLEAAGRTLAPSLRLDPPAVGAGAPPVGPRLRPAMERALIEWDWKLQDGIGTERNPSTYPEAVARTIERGDRLVADLCGGSASPTPRTRGEQRPLRGGVPPGSGGWAGRSGDPPEFGGLGRRGDTGSPRVRGAGGAASLPDPLARWEALKREYESLVVGPTGSLAWEGFYLRLHWLRREIALANPLFPVGPLLFVKQVPGCFSHQLTQYYGRYARPGGGLFVLDRPGASLAARELAPGALPTGSFMHPEVSFDGRRLLFAYCRTDIAPKNAVQGEPGRHYHLYEMGSDGSGLRQLTDGPHDDFSPRHLPDGKLLFISTRRGGWHRCGSPGCENYVLTVADAGGRDPRPISFHETQEWDPALLHDGRIIYTRWDYVDRHPVFYEHLWSTFPDGTRAAAYFGNNTLNPIGIWEPQPVPGSGRVMATAAAHHAMTAGSIVLVDVGSGVDGLPSLTRLTPDAPFPESETNVSGKWFNPRDGAKAVETPESRRWPGHCYRSPYPLSETYFLAAYSFQALVGEPTGNPANMFGLYLCDAFGNRELLYRDPNIASLWPVPLRARPRPPVVPSQLDPSLGDEGVLLLQDVYASIPEIQRGSVKALRVVQVLPKSTPGIDQPPVGLARGAPGKQVLGTVPVEADGSAYFRVPARKEIAFQALDERGLAVQVMRSGTYLQPGERATCVGCHESRTTAPVRTRPLALARAPSRIAPGPDGSKPFSYPILVQPILDRHCVGCHGGAKPAGGISLAGTPEGRYTASYNVLAARVPFSDLNNGEPLSRPGRFGARGSKVMAQLLAGHHDVRLSPEEIVRLATWMDVSALFYGTFDPADQARQQRGERIAGPALE